jgi:hypothetical protein
MKIQIALSAAGDWTYPKDADLSNEYRYEYALPKRGWPQRCKTIGAKYPVFTDESDFIRKVKASPIVELPPTAYVHNMTDYETIDDIEDLVAGYAFPRDVKRIVKGLSTGVTMPAPIIVKGKKGMWILSGNTRQNVALVLGVPRKFILVDAS